MKNSFYGWCHRASLLYLLVIAAIPFAALTYAEQSPPNLAIEASVDASESYGQLTPDKANDGLQRTRWSGIPGHNTGVWYQLQWNEPLEVGEVIIHQYDTFVFELDLQVRLENTNDWLTVQHFGQHGKHLSKVVVCRFEPRKVTAVRIANITNGPSFNEVQVYSKPFAGGITTQLASDLRGNFIGIVTDTWGSMPYESAAVTLSGHSKAGPWQETVHSNDKGLFTVPMPLGLSGKIEVQTLLKIPQKKELTFESQVDAYQFAYRLTPRQARQNIKDLSGKWKFMPDPPEDFWKRDFDDTNWVQINVPAHWEMEGFHSDAGIGGYRLQFTPPKDGERIKLCFEGVYSSAEVWVNEQLIAVHEGGATPFEVDITDVIHKDGNLLALRVSEHTITSDDLDKMSLYAYFPLAGIMRPVYLFTVPEVHIGGIQITTDFDKNYCDANMTVRVCILNESSKTFRGDLNLRLTGPLPVEEQVAQSKPKAVEIAPFQTTELEILLPVAEPKKWDAERPNLYLLSAQLFAGGQVVNNVTMRTGFRQTEIRGSEILVNGRPVKLRGTCHHDSHPLMGRAVTAELTRKDLELMKKANLNSVRTSHYPPLPELLDIADEIGLYVEDEASFCWASGTNDLRRTPRIIQLTAELLARDRNHPSVTFWSICNESQFGYGFQRSHEWVRSADPSRPTSAGLSAWLEIATLHNPLAISRIDEHENLDQPLIFDESLCIYQGVFNDVAEMWIDPGMRDYYAQPQPAIYDRFMKSKTTQGSYIWCWSDDIFCVPGRGYEYGRGRTRSHFLENSYRVPGCGIVGDAPWGVVDGWRRLKPEYWITKKLHSPVKIKEGPLAIPSAGEPIRIPVENQYDFTNLSELNIYWQIGSDRGRIKTNVPPRSEDTLEIQTSRRLNEGEILTLKFEDSHGRLVDVYRLPLGKELPPVPPYEKCTPETLRIWDEASLAGSCTTVAGKDFQLAFDHASGFLRRGVAKTQPLLLEIPTLHFLPTARPLQPLPDRIDWKLEKLDIKRDGENVVVTIDGAHKDFQGGYLLTITPSGRLLVESSFEYTGEEFLAREIGLRFSVPSECSILEWERKGEWSVYPSDHIGRLRGTAPAFPESIQPDHPLRPWSQDISPMGSNDFRSTKRNIYWAAIHCPDGPGVLIESDSSKHLRAFVETDRISVHVNDWFGGTNVGWWEWVHNYGKGKVVRKGDRIESKLQLAIAPVF